MRDVVRDPAFDPLNAGAVPVELGPAYQEQVRNFHSNPRMQSTALGYLFPFGDPPSSFTAEQLPEVDGVRLTRLTTATARLEYAPGFRIPAAPGMQFKAGADRLITKGTASRARIGIIAYNSAGAVVTAAWSPAPTVGGQTRPTVTLVIPANTTEIALGLETPFEIGSVVEWRRPMLILGAGDPVFFDGDGGELEDVVYSWDGRPRLSPSRATSTYSLPSLASPTLSALPHLQGSDTVKVKPFIPGVVPTFVDFDSPIEFEAGERYRVTATETLDEPQSGTLADQARSLEVVPATGSHDFTAARTGAFSLGHPAGPIPQQVTGNERLYAGWNATSRSVFEWPTDMLRFRIHMKNGSFLEDKAGIGTVDVREVYVGTAEVDAFGRPTGGFGDRPFRVSRNKTTIVGGAEVVTDWIPPQLWSRNRGDLVMISLGINSFTPSVLWSGGTYGWLGASVLDAGRIDPIGPQTWTLLDVWIEFEFVGANPILVTVGHSLNGAGNVAFDQHPWIGEHQSWHGKWALQHGGISSSLAVGGSWTANYPDNSPKWNFYDSTAQPLRPTHGAVYATSSDIAEGVPIPDVKAAFGRMVARLRSKFPSIGDIIGLTEPGRIALDDPIVQANHDEFNAWLLTKPFGISGVADVAPLLSDPANPYRLRPDLNADGEHYTTTGHQIIADAVAPILLPLAENPRSTAPNTEGPHRHRLDFEANGPAKIRLWAGSNREGDATTWTDLAVRKL